MIDLDGAHPPTAASLGELVDDAVAATLYAALAVTALALEGAAAARAVWYSFGEWFTG